MAGYSSVVGTVDSVILADPDSSCIRILTFNGNHTILAGVPGSTGYKDGQGNASLFNTPTGLVVSPDNTSIMVLDYRNNLIRKVDISTGAASTYAGSIYTTITMATVNVDGAGTSATFYNMRGIAVSRKSSKFFVSVPFPVLRVVTFPNPTVSTILGSPAGTTGVVDGILGIDGLVSGTCTFFPSPDESFFISSDTTYRNIRRLEVSSLQVSTLAGSPGTNRITGCTDGSGTNTLFSSPGKVLFSPSASEVYIADKANYGIRKLNLLTLEASTFIGSCPIAAPTVDDGIGISIYITDMVMSSDNAYIYAAQAGRNGIKRIEITSRSVTTIGASSSLPISPLSGYSLVLKPAFSSCTACASGKYSLDGQTCVLCPIGTFCQSASLPPTGCQSGKIATETINHTPFFDPSHEKCFNYFICFIRTASNLC